MAAPDNQQNIDKVGLHPIAIILKMLRLLSRTEKDTWQDMNQRAVARKCAHTSCADGKK